MVNGILSEYLVMIMMQGLFLAGIDLSLSQNVRMGCGV
jgi:hypothetical protein